MNTEEFFQSSTPIQSLLCLTSRSSVCLDTFIQVLRHRWRGQQRQHGEDGQQAFHTG